MISFASDYCEGCHPQVLEALVASNLCQTVGYGCDEYCAAAAQKLREVFASPEAAVHFSVGGTQTNLLAIAQVLRPHEAVLAASTGHISVHETGAIEATGHKVIELPPHEGKLRASDLAACLQAYASDETREHRVKPRLIYLSQTTEMGTVYTKAELEAIRRLATEYKQLIYLDGARLISALASPDCDLVATDYPQYCDLFSVGGTKAGLLFGEALFIVHPALQADFRYLQKQRGALLAKGRLLGLQFSQLMAHDLYKHIGAHENALAARLAAGLRALGFTLAAPPSSNQIFAYLPNALIEQLLLDFIFDVMPEPGKAASLIRLCTSWASSAEQVEAFLRKLSIAVQEQGTVQLNK